MKTKKTTLKGTASKKEVMDLISRDRKAYSNSCKREHLMATAPKYYWIGGVPHKSKDGVMVPLTPLMK